MKSLFDTKIANFTSLQILFVIPNPDPGHDTTASAISWILYSLAEHPEIQAKCQLEIDMVLEQTGHTELQWYVVFEKE